MLIARQGFLIVGFLGLSEPFPAIAEGVLDGFHAYETHLACGGNM